MNEKNTRQDAHRWMTTLGMACTYGALIILGLTLLVQLVLVAGSGGRSQELAAWVQAAGSILAIVAAIIIGNMQYRRSIADEARRRAETDLELKSVLKIIFTPLQYEMRNRLLEAYQVLEAKNPNPRTLPIKLSHIATLANGCNKQIREMRDMFLYHPSAMLVHTHLVNTLELIERQAKLLADVAHHQFDPNPPPFEIRALKESIDRIDLIMQTAGHRVRIPDELPKAAR